MDVRQSKYKHLLLRICPWILAMPLVPKLCSISLESLWLTRTFLGRFNVPRLCKRCTFLSFPAFPIPRADHPQYVAQTPPPVPGSHPQSRPLPWESDESLMGSPYDNTTPASRSYSRPSINNPSISNSQRSPHSPHPSRSPPHSRRNTHDSAVGMSQIRPAATSQRSGEIEVAPLDGVTPMASSRTAGADSIRGKRDPRTPPAAHLRGTANFRDNGLPLPFRNRRPPTHPALLPEYRYCDRDGLVKPMRAHHCRSCGTVSMLLTCRSRLSAN